MESNNYKSLLGKLVKTDYTFLSLLDQIYSNPAEILNLLSSKDVSANDLRQFNEVVKQITIFYPNDVNLRENILECLAKILIFNPGARFFLLFNCDDLKDVVIYDLDINGKDRINFLAYFVHKLIEPETRLPYGYDCDMYYAIDCYVNIYNVIPVERILKWAKCTNKSELRYLTPQVSIENLFYNEIYYVAQIDILKELIDHLGNLEYVMVKIQLLKAKMSEENIATIVIKIMNENDYEIDNLIEILKVMNSFKFFHLITKYGRLNQRSFTNSLNIFITIFKLLT
ncbi:hypothetical protein A0H76_842 [Hepatospora eriocheir]|uniref:Uncharacterized protein n=1 Tax=Hepatospora eriocheir TaxID=1081669 RepID=A0A1X0QI32_9MICR|nr:hypothetical protein A0H76_842 [Hepatospora eriocheir]